MLLHLPANSNLKQDQFNCGTRPGCTGGAAGCTGGVTGCVVGIGGCAGGYRGATDGAGTAWEVVVLVVLHWLLLFMSSVGAFI